VILIFNNLNIHVRDFNLIKITLSKKKKLNKNHNILKMLSLKNDFYEKQYIAFFSAIFLKIYDPKKFVIK
jgi:hypothetical protein